MKQIPLTQGKTALVDDEDYERIAAHKWHAQNTGDGRHWYAYRHIYNNGRRRTVLMHREILCLVGAEVVDHADHNGLNNTKSNLRSCTRWENAQNRCGAQANSKTGIRGVCFDSSKGKYRADICAFGVKKFLGAFPTITEAANAYAAAMERFAAFRGER